MKTELRNATLADLATTLQHQHEAKIDVVVRADQITARDGNLIVPGINTTLTDDGVTATPGTLRPTEVCDGTLADKLGIPVKYLRRVRTEGLQVPGFAFHDGTALIRELPLIDAMLNAHFATDERTVLVRGFKGADGTPGIGRAVLSDSYQLGLDNLDSLMAVLDGVRQSGVDAQVTKVDLSERAMRVHFVAPGLKALAPTLLAGYTAPTPGMAAHGFYTPENRPEVWAGFVASNSETGGGAFTIVPRLVVPICSNGLTVTKDAMRRVHLGSKMEEGVVRWSADTQRANVDLIAKQATDAVRTFLDIDYMTGVIEGIEAKAGTPIEKPLDTVKVVAQRMRYSDDERETLLSFFITGGQVTSGGMLNAVTAMAQTVSDPDRAAEIESGALDAFALVS